jgi:hypothetical protein
MDADEFDEAVFQFKKATELSQVGLCLVVGCTGSGNRSIIVVAE